MKVTRNQVFEMPCGTLIVCPPSHDPPDGAKLTGKVVMGERQARNAARDLERAYARIRELVREHTVMVREMAREHREALATAVRNNDDLVRQIDKERVAHAKALDAVHARASEEALAVYTVVARQLGIIENLAKAIAE